MPAMIEIAGLLSAFLGSWVDFWIIVALLLTNATLGFIEEMNAQASISALKDGMVRKLPVKRDGKFELSVSKCKYNHFCLETYENVRNYPYDFEKCFVTDAFKIQCPIACSVKEVDAGSTNAHPFPTESTLKCVC